MNFQEFLKFRQTVLLSEPDILDAGETRVAQALGHLRTSRSLLRVPERAHRCHLAEFWLDSFKLDRALKPQALVSQGVRDSLKLLFEQFSARGLRVHIPRDVYPAYGSLAQAARLAVTSFPTYPELDLTRLTDADVLLITNPLKPRGGLLSQDELSVITGWLAQSAIRRVVIDAVYALTAPFDPVTQVLWDTGQAIILHSLSKAYVSPLLMGICLIPEADVDELTPMFRGMNLPQEGLKLAQALLTQDTGVPGRVSETLALKRARLERALIERDTALTLLGDVPGYMFVVPASANELLARFKILAIPYSVYGSELGSHSILSSLAC